MARRKLAQVSARYGAPMGRPSYDHRERFVFPHEDGSAATFTACPKLHLQRVRINAGGYDEGGAYWGTGEPLYWAWDDDGEVQMFVRAADREEAKRKLQARQLHGILRFYR